MSILQISDKHNIDDCVCVCTHVHANCEYYIIQMSCIFLGYPVDKDIHMGFGVWHDDVTLLLRSSTMTNMLMCSMLQIMLKLELSS